MSLAVALNSAIAFLWGIRLTVGIADEEMAYGVAIIAEKNDCSLHGDGLIPCSVLLYSIYPPSRGAPLFARPAESALFGDTY